MTTMPPPLLDKHQLAVHLGKSVSWVEKQCAARRIPVTMVGRAARWTAEQVAQIYTDMQAQRPSPPPTPRPAPNPRPTPIAPPPGPKRISASRAA